MPLLLSLQETLGVSALLDFSAAEGFDNSSSVDPAESQVEMEPSSSQDGLSPVAPSASPVSPQPSFDSEAAEKTDLPLESGESTCVFALTDHRRVTHFMTHSSEPVVTSVYGHTGHVTRSRTCEMCIFFCDVISFLPGTNRNY